MYEVKRYLILIEEKVSLKVITNKKKNNMSIKNGQKSEGARGHDKWAQYSSFNRAHL